MGKVKASSLLEVVVALVVILTLFGIGMTVYINVTSSGSQGIKLEVTYLLEQEAAITVAEKSFRDEQIALENVTIFKVCQLYNGTADLMEIRLEALAPDGRFLASHREIVLLEKE